MKISQLAQLLDGTLYCGALGYDGESLVSTMAPLDTADRTAVSFLHNPKYARAATSSHAAVIIAAEPIEGAQASTLVVTNPYACWARTGQHFYPKKHAFANISEKATIAETTTLGTSPRIAANVTIGENTQIGNNAVLYPGVVIGAEVKIGDNALIYPNVVIGDATVVGDHVIIQAGAVIGSDGFGFAPDRKEIIKVPQLGSVRIGHHVEIGANVCIDRGAIGETILEDYVKLDNLIQIGHGVRIGHMSMLAAQTGIAGGTAIGHHFVAAGQVGINGHIKIPENVTCGGQSAIVKAPDTGQTVIGFPAIDANLWRRQQVRLKQLSDLFKRVKTLEKQLHKEI